MTDTIKKDKAPSPCNCLNLRRAALSMTKLYDDFLVPSGLTVSQQSLLRHVKALAPVSVRELADKMRLDRTTLVRNLLPLEEAGLIVDAAAPGSRSRELQLSEKGEEKCAEAIRLWSEAQRYMEQELGRENIALLTELLSRVENLDAPPAVRRG